MTYSTDILEPLRFLGSFEGLGIFLIVSVWIFLTTVAWGLAETAREEEADRKFERKLFEIAMKKAIPKLEKFGW